MISERGKFYWEISSLLSKTSRPLRLFSSRMRRLLTHLIWDGRISYRIWRDMPERWRRIWREGIKRSRPLQSSRSLIESIGKGTLPRSPRIDSDSANWLKAESTKRLSYYSSLLKRRRRILSRKILPWFRSYPRSSWRDSMRSNLRSDSDWGIRLRE